MRHSTRTYDKAATDGLRRGGHIIITPNGAPNQAGGAIDDNRGVHVVGDGQDLAVGGGAELVDGEGLRG